MLNRKCQLDSSAKSGFQQLHYKWWPKKKNNQAIMINDFTVLFIVSSLKKRNGISFLSSILIINSMFDLNT